MAAPNPLLESAVEAIELDAWNKDVQESVMFSKTLYGGFKRNATTIPVSFATAAGGITRPSFRVPLRIQAGSAISQGTGNADSLLRGTGSQYVGFALSPIFFFNNCEISYLARMATMGRQRGLFNVQARELQNSHQQAEQGLEALLQGDGTGALDQIPTTATINNNTGTGPSTSSIVGMNNAFQFTDQQTVQVISTGGTNRGSFTISFVDPVANTIYSASALPAGTATTDYLVVSGSAGTAGASILGLKAWQVNSNTGTIAGLSRASYPGRLSTPTINLQEGSISKSTALRAKTLMLRALGEANMALKSGHWYCGPDQATQITNLYLNVLTARVENARPGNTPDMATSHWPQSYGDFPLTVGMNATPGRLDLFTWNTWTIGELIPLQLYDFADGQTMAPVPDVGTTNGTYLTSTMFVYVASLNLVNGTPKAGCYVQNAAQPII